MTSAKPLRRKKTRKKSAPPKKEGLFRRLFHGLRGYFLTGLVVAAPISITVYLTVWFVELVDGQVRVLVPEQYYPDNFIPFTIPGLGLIIIITSLVLLGALTANIFGRGIVSLGENIVERMPIIRTLYATLKQIFETVFMKDTMPFQKAGLIEYPRKGVYALVFLTMEGKGEMAKKINLPEPLVGVFLPTTPNPTSGFFLMVPKKSIIPLDMKVEDAAKLVISAGIVEPEENKVVPINQEMKKTLT